MKHVFGLLAGLLLFTLASQAQTFRYRAAVEKAPQPGFYRIVLSPQVLGHLNESLSDIRLYDDQEQEVPYLLQREQPLSYHTLFKEYKVVSKEIKPKVGTRLVLQNATKSRINNLSLQIKNANVSKKAKLSGSNDAQSWYVIEDDYRLEAIDNRQETAEVKMLHFPLSDYEYYLLEINDSLSAPLNILRAGYYDTYAENGKYISIPGLSMEKKDSSATRQTYVRVQLSDTGRIDKITVRIGAPAYYRRWAQLGQWVEKRSRKGRKQRSFEAFSSLELRSDGENAFYPSGFKARDFYLIIDNEDNRPLSIEQIEAQQLNTYLIGQLEANRNYHLAFSNEQVGLPSYDLRYYQDKIPTNLTALNVQLPVSISSAVGASSTTLFTNRHIIWLAIGLVLVVLSYMSFQMLKEVGKNKA
jgi:hypothetical protein